MDMIRLDLASCSRERIGDAGLDSKDAAAERERLQSIAEELHDTDFSGMDRWRRLPYDPMRNEHVSGIASIREQLAPDIENLVVLGIGGSALGATALQSALNPLTWNLLPSDQRAGPRLFVLDNIDPDLVGSTLREVLRVDPRLRRTVFNVVSKSGETAETAAQLSIVRSMLDETGPHDAPRIVATTDAGKGTLRDIAMENQWPTLPVPDGVGGRFSVLSPVALLPAAMCGIDIESLLDGAAAMDVLCTRKNPDENPAIQLAWTLISMERRGRRNHVLMPYSNRLAPMAAWYRQLWAESLGKRLGLDGSIVHAGATPIGAIGATDQHSQIQLYREGPDDKVIGFVAIDKHEEHVPIPRRDETDSADYLRGRDLVDLLHAERRATEYAMVESGRPSFTIHLPRLDAAAVGQFIWLWQMATACAGSMLEIDPYDQPAVETGKQATFGLMGRPGYEKWSDRVHETLD